ncbi:hypothetical protein LOTGIDRAFT_157117 [Lottia gigantea]|uniref:RING-type domain-containing protein n=1 Tax=Lottia gigantea TaxID=225164 RepID=V4B8C8_LOTGI|nr:hypothetical protein LOTGIDRAFT_157117 [Lottia gigantea]ESP01982.1 hypothetical protein LOTGIDRAFT_157117 [Lottia gigantea]
MANCPVCLENFNRPTTCIPCGHMFCYECISNWRHTHFNSNVCPQCRCSIKQLQRVYLGDTDNLVLTQSQSSLTSFSSEKFQWFRQQFDNLYFNINRFKEWRQRLNVDDEIFHDDNNDDDDEPSHTFLEDIQHFTERIRVLWRELQISQKCMILFGVFLLSSLIIQDSQSSTGFLHGLILPILDIVVNFFTSLISTILFIFIRPLLCLWNILSELLIAVFEIVYSLFYAIFYAVWTILLIPYAICCAIFNWFTNICYYFVETVIALLRLGIVCILVGMSYLFLVDLNQREEALNILLRKYQTIRSALPTKHQLRSHANNFQNLFVAFVHSLSQKVTEQNQFQPMPTVDN